MQVGVTTFVVLTTDTEGLPRVTVARTLVVVLVTRRGVTVLVRMIVVEAAKTVDAGSVMFSATSMTVEVAFNTAVLVNGTVIVGVTVIVWTSPTERSKSRW